MKKIISSNVTQARSLLRGHHEFLMRNTGNTVDPTTDLFVLNPQDILSNNRHYISPTRQEYQPSGDATTEGQSIHVLGYVYAYQATGDIEYLEYAERYWQAYVDHFYAGQPIPDTPQRWICNWLVNGKEPTLANYPVDPINPTHGGFKGSEFTFTNGMTVIPHGAPHYGEYLDVCTFAFEGVLAWGQINASVRALNPDGSTDWSNDGIEYPMDWIIAWTGDKIDWDGDVISSGHDPSEYGTVQLKDTNVNGVYKLNYATRNPVAHGGYEFKRNEVWHNRPVHAPLLGPVEQMGNAADAELWFADCCHLLYEITGNIKYKKALDCTMFNIQEYALIDSHDMFFRQSNRATTPYTDGISYDYQYPGGIVATYDRDINGYIRVVVDGAGSNWLEQQSIQFRIKQDSSIVVTVGGDDSNADDLTTQVDMKIGLIKGGGGDSYSLYLPNLIDSTITRHELPVSALIAKEKPDGTRYVVANSIETGGYGGAVVNYNYSEAILGTHNATVMSVLFPDDDAGVYIDFFQGVDGTEPITAISYRSDADFNLRFSDSDDWRWYWLLPSTGMGWVNMILDPNDLNFSGYQPNRNGRPDPLGPVYDEVDSITILLDGAEFNKTFEYYSINEVPAKFTGEDGYTNLFTLEVSSESPFTYYVGDCVIINHRDDALAYTPGVIPFSNIYSQGSDQISAWRGLPYPGYQVPHLYTLGIIQGEERYLDNVVNFMWDSQEWYASNIGVMGPGAAAYIWNRVDNTAYGPADTFINYHFNHGTAWSGYQPRAFSWAARCWQEMVDKGQTPPDKLVQYIERWIVYLVDYYDQHGITPTDFPMNTPPAPIYNDFTGHMSGLWLSGACMAFMAGCRVDGIQRLIEGIIGELMDNYEVISPDNAMNGSWSPWAGGGMFFGFWAGEIMKGLGLYIKYQNEYK